MPRSSQIAGRETVPWWSAALPSQSGLLVPPSPGAEFGDEDHQARRCRFLPHDDPIGLLSDLARVGRCGSTGAQRGATTGYASRGAAQKCSRDVSTSGVDGVGAASRRLGGHRWAGRTKALDRREGRPPRDCGRDFDGGHRSLITFSARTFRCGWV